LICLKTGFRAEAKMTRVKDVITNEEGSVLIVALVILVLITIMGLTVTRNADIDIQIAKNEREYVQEFYTADSAWREAIQWMDTRASAPDHVNRALFISGATDNSEYFNVRNYGEGNNGIYNIDADGNPSGTKDGTLGSLDYWYKVARLNYMDSGTNQIIEEEPLTAVIGFSGVNSSFLRFSYVIRGATEGGQKVDVTVTKVFKSGYQ
jgi:hypothetical protein